MGIVAHWNVHNRAKYTTHCEDPDVQEVDKQQDPDTEKQSKKKKTVLNKTGHFVQFRYWTTDVKLYLK